MTYRRRRDVVEETQSLREYGYSDEQIWQALGYRNSECWKRVLRLWEKDGPGRTYLRDHGTHYMAIKKQCGCDKCTPARREIYDRANERKRADRAELRTRRASDTP